MQMLTDGQILPLIGFGTYRLNGKVGAQTITMALRAGYRLIDTAFNYQNEGAVGYALQHAGIKRSSITVQSKLPGKYYANRQAIIATVQESLLRTRLDYFDVYLLHWPNPLDNHYVEAWQGLIELQQFGLVKSIGVCNFLPEHLERLYTETGVKPTVNQIELHPYFNQTKQVKYNTEHNIITQAWSPLGRASSVLTDPLLVSLADKYHKNVGQIILRWQTQLGVIPLPKATSYQRQLSNLAVFDFKLSPAEMIQIAHLTKPDGRINNQDPAVYQEF